VEGKQAAGSFKASDSWTRMNTLLSTATSSFADPALFAAFLVVNARDAAASAQVRSIPLMRTLHTPFHLFAETIGNGRKGGAAFRASQNR
jgi:hypothetical protein